MLPNTQASPAQPLEWLGLQREGLLREGWFVDGEAQNSVIQVLLRREWRGA
jgi:RimJ/RimL family protein N-acetyltransferase